MTDEAFFRRAWLTLKATNPRLRKRMTEIECGLEGIRVHEQEIKPVKAESRVKENDGTDEIIPI